MPVIIDGDTGITIPEGIVATGNQLASAEDIPKLAFPSGTMMMFAQTSAPTGWTKDTTNNDKALRVVSGTAGTGGSVDFSTAFASRAVSGSIGDTTATNQSTTATNQSTTATNQSTTATGTVGNTTLTTTQIPAHSHPIPNLSQRIANRTGVSGSFEKNDGNFGLESTSNTGGGGAHNHGFTGTAHNHTQDAHNHTQNAHNHTQNAHNHTFTGTAIDMSVKYVDVIIARKD